MRLAANLFWFWLFHDHHAEGLAWLDRALARGAAAPAALRAQALCAAGPLAGFAHDLARAQALLTQGVALRREIGDPRQLSWALSTLGWALWWCGQAEQAATVQEEGLALARALDEPWLIAYALMHGTFRVASTVAIDRAEERTRAWAAGTEALHIYQAVGDRIHAAVTQAHLGRIALYDGDFARARALARDAYLPLMRALSFRTAVAESLVHLAHVGRAQGDYGEATACYMEALAVYRHLGDHWSPSVAWVLSRLAAIALEQGAWTAAQTYVAESLVLVQDARHDAVPNLADQAEVRAALAADDPTRLSSFTAAALPGALEIQATLAAVQGIPDCALRLAGAAAALRARLNRPLAPAEQTTLERRLAPARQALSAEEQATAWAAGQAMTREQAIADALAGLLSPHGPPLRRE
jgi:tetratricopeptide (TPR) repeat protein